MAPNFMRPGTTQLARSTLLGAHILGLCETANAEIRLVPQAHQDRSQQLYTLAHEAEHRVIFMGTTFGYMQFLLARMGSLAMSRPLPPQFSGHKETLDEMMAVSLEAHEGYATICEYLLHDAVASLGRQPPLVPKPTPQYEQAIEPYRHVWETLPQEILPFSYFILRAFAEVVFDTDAIMLAQGNGVCVATLRESLGKPNAQPNHRLERLSATFAEILEKPLGPEWSYFLQLSSHMTVEELTEAISSLRLSQQTTDTVVGRKTILKRAREAVRATLRCAGGDFVVADGIGTVVHFHNSCYEDFRHIPLLDGPMMSFDADPQENAKHLIKFPGVSGHPDARLNAIEVKDDVQACVNFMHSNPKARLAVHLRIHERGMDRSEPVCQIRIIKFEAKTDSWNGEGTQPYQRIFADSLNAEQYMSVVNTTQLFDQLRDRIDIIHHCPQSTSESWAQITTAIVGTTKATEICLLDSLLAEPVTDKAKIDSLTQYEHLRGCVPYADDDWVAIFYELAPRSFLGAIVLRISLMSRLGQDSEILMQRLGESQQQALTEDEDYKVSLGAISTFAKLYIAGAFLDLENH